MNRRGTAAIFSFLLAAALLSPSGLPAQEDELLPSVPNVFIGPVLGNYQPADAVFKQVYGNGGSMFGLQAGWHFYRDGNFSLAFSVEFKGLSLTGASTATQTESRISIKPLSFGLEGHLQRRVVGLWFGGGLVSIAYSEESALQNTSGSKTGIHIDGGLIFQVPSFPLAALKLYGRWSKAVVAMTDFETDLGGMEYGLSLLFRFKI